MFSWSDATLSPAGKPMMKLETPRSMYWRRSAAICSGRAIPSTGGSRQRRCVETDVGAEGQVNGVLVAPCLYRPAAQAGDEAGQFLRLQYRGGTQADGHPAVAVAGGAADGRAGVSANPDGRVRLLRWLGRKSAAGNLVELAIEGRGIAGPQLLVQLDVLIGNRAAPGVAVQAQGLELFLHPAHRLRPG